MSRDEEGHREYKVSWRIKGERTDGPATVLLTPGLPLPGATWSLFGDEDLWAWCRPNSEIKAEQPKEGDPTRFWIVEQTFSTKPIPWNKAKCTDHVVGDPLLEPMKISGGFTRRTEQATHDRFGYLLVNSAHEQLNGPQVEFERSTGQVKIEQNVLNLELPLISLMRDTVNDRQMWGIPPRCIKLSDISWERKYYGQCHVYYTRTFTFDIDIRVKYEPTSSISYIGSGFDRDIPDIGNSALNGYLDPITKEWVLVLINNQDPDPLDPTHFVRYQDPNGNTKGIRLDGAGKPWKPIPETVTACDQCSTRAPKYWQVSGFFNSGFFADSQFNLKLTHQSGCQWSGTTESGDGVDLQYDDGEDQWVLTVQTDQGNPISQETWTLDGGDWSCMGANIIPRDDSSPAAAGPNYVILLPVQRNPAGIHHVEYYNESNFFLLGIPTEL